MLAITAKDLDTLPYPLYASVKLDGIRCLVNGGGQSRSGERFPNPHASRLLSGLPDGLDGELCVLDANGVPDFRRTGGALQRLTGEPKLVYYVFDLWNHRGSFSARAYALGIHDLNAWPDWVVYHPQTLVRNAEEVRRLFAKAVAAGQEGLILKRPDSLYKGGKASGKNATEWKVKPYEDSEAVILSVFERMHNTNEATKDALGHTKRSNTKGAKEGTGLIGGFVCCTLEARMPKGVLQVLAGNTLRDMGVAAKWVKENTFEVSAGKMTHVESAKLWQGRAQLVGRTIRFQHVTVGGYDKPRHGTFQGFREAWDLDSEGPSNAPDMDAGS